MASSAGVPCGKPWAYGDKAELHEGWVETWWRTPVRGSAQIGDLVMIDGGRYIVQHVAPPDPKETQPPEECKAGPMAAIVRIVAAPEA